MKIIGWAFRLGFLKKYRRRIGIYVLLASAAIEFLTNPELVGVCGDATLQLCGWLAAIQPTLLAIGGYIAGVGELFRNDAAGMPKKKR